MPGAITTFTGSEVHTGRGASAVFPGCFLGRQGKSRITISVLRLSGEGCSVHLFTREMQTFQVASQ